MFKWQEVIPGMGPIGGVRIVPNQSYIKDINLSAKQQSKRGKIRQGTKRGKIRQGTKKTVSKILVLGQKKQEIQIQGTNNKKRKIIYGDPNKETPHRQTT